MDRSSSFRIVRFSMILNEFEWFFNEHQWSRMSLNALTRWIIQLEWSGSFKSNDPDLWPNALEYAGPLDHSTWMCQLVGSFNLNVPTCWIVQLVWSGSFNLNDSINRLIQTHWANDQAYRSWIIKSIKIERPNMLAHSSLLGQRSRLLKLNKPLLCQRLIGSLG